MKIFLTRLISIISVFIAINLTFSKQINAETSVWKIEKNNHIVYLGGTIHLLRPSDYPLPEGFNEAYQAAQIITFETDIQLMSTPAIAKEMFYKLSYADERTIKSEVSDETYLRLNEYAESVGISLELMKKAKPGLIMSAMMLSELKKIGVSQEGIDMFYLKRSNLDNKKLEFLESPQQQIDMLANLGVGTENAFYQNMLREFVDTQSLFLTILKHWRNGNNKQLDDLVNQPMKSESPQIYQSILVDRNNNWLPQIESYFETQETEFILVGAAHLIGDDGLLMALQNKGYKISQLK